jgi:hypothetical protein
MGRAWLRKEYGEQADAFASTVSTEEPLLSGLDDAIANMKAVDVLIRSATTGGWETF